MDWDELPPSERCALASYAERVARRHANARPSERKSFTQIAEEVVASGLLAQVVQSENAAIYDRIADKELSERRDLSPKARDERRRDIIRELIASSAGVDEEFRSSIKRERQNSDISAFRN